MAKVLRILGRGLLALALAAGLLGIPAVASSADEAQPYADGVYQVQAKVAHATQPGQKSMATAAFDNVLQNGAVDKDSDTRLLTLVVRDGRAYLEARMIPIDRKLGKSSFTGYLGYLEYYPDYHEAAPPVGHESTAALADSYYDVEDGYNRASGGSDVALRGQKYPEVLSLQIDPAYPELWIQVYVPVMESISTGSGSQFAKIELDYATMQRIEDESQVATAQAIAERHAASVQGGYQNLANEVTAASKELLATGTYTAASLGKLRTARNSAQEVYEARTADVFGVLNVIVGLSSARQQLVKKKPSSPGKKNNSGSKKSEGSKNKKSNGSGTAKGGSKSSKLNFRKLADGTYTVYGEMIKTDRKQQSMSNAAIDHSIRIRVKNGSYTVRMTFSVLHYSGKTGALGKLWYFKSGYKGAGQGYLSGSRGRARTLSYLTTASGAKFRDEFGTNYPKTVSFPLISEAKADGWVPLQVFVPVMEGISAGTGTQGVYLRLHTGSVVRGSKKASGKSTGTSARDVSTSSAGATASGSGSSGASGDNGTDVSSLLDGGAGSGMGDANGDAAVAGLADGGSDGSGDSGDGGSSDGAGDGSSDQQGSSAQSNQQQAPATAVAANEPPLRRYIGLIVGIPALIACLACAFALFRRRGQVRGLARSRS